MLVPVRASSEKAKPATRYTPASTLTVNAKTIGTKLNFRMPIVNLSETGMLLSWDEPQRIPFNVNTILELSIDKESAQSDYQHNNQNIKPSQEISCLAKVVHTGTQQDGKQRFGLKIIQSDEEDLMQWNSLIREMESQKKYLNFAAA